MDRDLGGSGDELSATPDAGPSRVGERDIVDPRALHDPSNEPGSRRHHARSRGVARRQKRASRESNANLFLPTLQFPTPHPIHASYPNYTQPDIEALSGSGVEAPLTGSKDWRWFNTKYDGGIYKDAEVHLTTTTEDDERAWVGPIL